MIDPEDPVLTSATPRLVTCEAGDLLLWDSRTIHCNSPAVSEPTSSPEQLLRAVVYICMTPVSSAKPGVVEARRLAYNNRITTSHWPHLFPIGSADYQTSGKQDFDDLGLDSLRRRLVVGRHYDAAAATEESAAAESPLELIATRL